MRLRREGLLDFQDEAGEEFAAVAEVWNNGPHQ
jgi:hypothetical protein